MDYGKEQIKLADDLRLEITKLKKALVEIAGIAGDGRISEVDIRTEIIVLVQTALGHFDSDKEKTND